LKRNAFILVIATLIFGFIASYVFASATNGSAATVGAPCFHLEFRDNVCSGYVKNAVTLELLPGGDVWYRHVIYNGREGYVSSHYLNVIQEPIVALTPALTPIPTPIPTPAPAPTFAPTGLSQKADQIISDAQSFIGRVQYAFGINDPKHLIFDCSSFTKYVFASAGINLVWSSSGQSKQGKPIYNKADLQKGDLVHFSVNTPGQINHVGIFIGNGKFIHNTTGSTYGVKISDINSGWYAGRFIVGTRVIV
jgi:lipoprotein Spr